MARKKIVIKEQIKIGDAVETIIKATGLDIFVKGKDCGCDKRKEKLNTLFSTKLTANCMDEIQYNLWSDFRNERSVYKITNDQVIMISELYANLFNRKVYYPCRGCSPKPLISMIDKIDKIWESYRIE